MKLHRSVIFWSGLLVIAFIMWAWRDSVDRSPGAGYHDTLLTTLNGGIGICHVHARNAPFEATYRGHSYPHPEWAACQPAFFIRGAGQQLNTVEEWENHMRQLHAAANARDFFGPPMRVESSRSWVLFIPHWMILLTFALLWAALLLWRARRRKKAMTNAELPNGE